MKLSAALGAAMMAIQSNGAHECAEADSTVLLQQGVRKSQPAQLEHQGSHLLSSAREVISKINAGDDPDGCGAASEATRAAVEELLPAIFDQHSHWANQISIALAAAGNCVSQVDLPQQELDLRTVRTTHRECRLEENRLQDGLESCQQYEELRNSVENPCFAFPNDESGFPEAVQSARDQLDVTFNQAVLLRETCISAREALATQQEECTTAQRRFEEDYCAYRSGCLSVQACHADAEGIYRQTVMEAQAALETLHAEYQTLVHVRCLLGHADDALEQTTIIDGETVAACSEPASTDDLTIEFPELTEPATCDSSVISQPPCHASFFAAEYESLPQHDAIQAACASCPGDVDEQPICSGPQHAGQYLSGHAAGDNTIRPIHESHERCIELLDQCAGITCRSETSCTVRAGRTLHGSPSGEFSFVKAECGLATAPPLPAEEECTCQVTDSVGHLPPLNTQGPLVEHTTMNQWVNTRGGISSLIVTKLTGTGTCIVRVAGGVDGASAMAHVYREGEHPYPMPTGNDNIRSWRAECDAE